MVSFAVMRNGMVWGEGQQGSYIEIPYGRSPNCSSDSNACYVISDGVVYYGVGNDVDWYSCGRNFYTKKKIILRSPYLGTFGTSNDVACLVDSDGDVSNFWDVDNSYGIK